VNMMSAARLYGRGDVRLTDEPVPEVPEGHVAVRVEAVGICGSDLHWFGEGSIGDATLDRPLVLGHEMSGRILDGPRSGELVAVDPAIPCWHCELCRAGEMNLCANLRFAGHGSTDGGMREQLSWPADRLHTVPESFTAITTALLEPLGVAIHAVDLARVSVAGTVAVVGCGPIGLLALQLARVAGAHTVVAVDPLSHRRDLARQLGADDVSSPNEAAACTIEATNGRGVDVVLEVAGPESAVAVAVDVARPAGRVVLAGIPDGDTTSFPASTARRKALTFVMARRMKEVYPRAIALVESGAIDVEVIVSDRFPLGQAAKAMQVAEGRRGHKVMVLPSLQP
jgi:L-iditol 2-dehydrogenase